MNSNIYSYSYHSRQKSLSLIAIIITVDSRRFYKVLFITVVFRVQFGSKNENKQKDSLANWIRGPLGEAWLNSKLIS